MPVKTVADLELRYSLEGEGPLTVFLHGFGGSPGDWREVTKGLQGHGRLLVVNIKPLFSHRQPLSFSKQVELLAEFIGDFVQSNEPLRLVGTSYGATLTYGLQEKLGQQVEQHVLINPMPLDPLKELRHPMLRWLFFIYRLPTGIFVFALTPVGRKYFEKLARLFHMGLGRRKKIRYFNQRKWRIIRRAIGRFLWIARSEDWEAWRPTTPQSKPSCVLIYGSQDFLFTPETYQRVGREFGSHQHVPVEGGGHQLVLSRPKLVTRLLRRLLEPKNTPLTNQDQLLSSKENELLQ